MQLGPGSYSSGTGDAISAPELSMTHAENRADFMKSPICEPCVTPRASPAAKVSDTNSYTHAAKKTWYQEKVRGQGSQPKLSVETGGLNCREDGRIETNSGAMTTLGRESSTYFQTLKGRVSYFRVTTGSKI